MSNELSSVGQVAGTIEVYFWFLFNGFV
jgi:hypothetical protein